MSLPLLLWRRRDLVKTLVARDLAVRYRQSVLGIFWSLGRPLFLMIILSVVFSVIWRQEVPGGLPYPAFLLAGLLPWFYLAGSLHESTASLLANASLLKKVSVPAAIFPSVAVLGNLTHWAIAQIGLAAVLLALGVVPNVTSLPWLIPALALQTALCLALALLLSIVNVWFRDVTSLTEVFLAGWFYISPVLYSVDKVRGALTPERVSQPDLWFSLYLMNPMAPILAAYRRALVLPAGAEGLSDAQLALWLCVSAATVAALYLAANRVFRRLSPTLADQL